jgi:hypothetical protein
VAPNENFFSVQDWRAILAPRLTIDLKIGWLAGAAISFDCKNNLVVAPKCMEGTSERCVRLCGQPSQGSLIRLHASLPLQRLMAQTNDTE